MQNGAKRPAELQQQQPGKKQAVAQQQQQPAKQQVKEVAVAKAAPQVATPVAKGKEAATPKQTPGSQQAGEPKSAKKNIRRWENGFEVEDVAMGEKRDVEGRGAGIGRAEVG